MKLHLYPVVTFVAAILIVGCGAAPTPTPTPAPTAVPTETPVPAPPTATRPPPTATRADVLPPAVAFALNKTQTARSMQFDFESAVTVLQDGETNKIPGLAIKGADSTLNRSVNISGTTTDTNELISYDVIVLGDKVYIKGLAGVPGIDVEKWYELPEASQAGVRRLPTARGLIASFDPADMGKAEFQSSGSEDLDGEKCSVWTAQNAQSIQQLIGVTDDSDLKTRLGEIDSSEFKIWTCADGFIHQLLGQVKGHATDNPENTTSVTLKFLMSDFESAVDIQAPADAQPFPTPPAQAQPTAVPEVPTEVPVEPTTEATEPAGEATEPAPSTTETVEAEASPTPQ